MQNIFIRPALAQDAGAMLDTHRNSVEALCSAAYTPQQIASWFEGRDAGIYFTSIAAGHVWIAENHGQVIGFVAATPGEVTLLFVHPAAVGAGLGRRLFEYGLCRSTKNFAGDITVIATVNSTEFYRKFGFEPVATEAFVRGESELHYPVIRMILPRSKVAAKAVGKE